jgi:hypothetical protein
MFITRSKTRADTESAIPGAVIAIQTFGDFLGFNPHCHVLVTDGCFYGTGSFKVAPAFELKSFEKLFRHKILKMLLAKEKITQDMINMLDTWKHTGFTVFCGNRIYTPVMPRPWRILPDTLSGHPFHMNG